MAAPRTSRAGVLLPVLAGAVLGPAGQLQQAALWPWQGYAVWLAVGLAGVLGLLVLARWRPRASASAGHGAPSVSGHGVALAPAWLWPLAWCAAGALVAGAATGWRAAAFAAGALSPALEGHDLLVTGRVVGLPQRSAEGVRFRLQVEAAALQGVAVTVPARIALAWYVRGEEAAGAPAAAAPLPLLRPGERWRLAVRLKAPHGHANPHGFDYELWLWEQGVQATGNVRERAGKAAAERLAGSAVAGIDRWRDAVRERIHARVPDPRWAGLLAALAVGDQGAIEREDWEVFRATGVAHLMSISGLHITMFAWVAALAVGAAWRRSTRLCLAWPAPQAALVGGLALAAGYAAFSGWGIPAQRTVWMLAAATVLRLGAHAWPWPATWLLACAVVVTVDPWALLQAGFWLSFVAVGVLFASGRSQAAVSGPAAADAEPVAPPAGWRAWASAALRQVRILLREQWVVTLALTPLALVLFGQVSLVGLLANLVAIPWVTLAVTPLALAGIAWPPAWDAAAAAASVLGRGLEVLAAWPWATASVAAAPAWAGAAAVAGGVLGVLRLPLAWRFLGLPLALPVLLWQPPRPPPGSFDLLAADVGQGNAVLVRTAHHALLYDAGPTFGRETDAGQRVLVPLLRALGVKPDLLLLSHGDTDHIGGAAAVLQAHPGTALASSLEPGHPLHRLRPGRPCHAGIAWHWDGVRFEVLHPASAASGGKPNARSCVLRIVAADGGRALLAGDIERPQELALVQGRAELRAHCLLVPHHGSSTLDLSGSQSNLRDLCGFSMDIRADLRAQPEPIPGRGKRGLRRKPRELDQHIPRMADRAMSHAGNVFQRHQVIHGAHGFTSPFCSPAGQSGFRKRFSTGSVAPSDFASEVAAAHVPALLV